VHEGRPVRVQVDRQGFASGAITQAAGPWRTSGQWWSAETWDRDEWDVSMADGTVYRLAVERGVGQWCVEGVID
jgi:protein ImuB